MQLQKQPLEFQVYTIKSLADITTQTCALHVYVLLQQFNNVFKIMLTKC